MRTRDDRGQLMLLVLVYALVAAALVTVLVDTGSVFIHRRSLAAVADGAALAAAQAIDRPAFYRGDAGDAIPLDPVAARSAVEAYIQANGLEHRFGDLVVDPPAISADGKVVTVQLRCRVALPFSAGFAGLPRTVEMSAAASARTPIG